MVVLLTGLSSMATRRLLTDLVASYETRTGYRVAIESTGGLDAARRIRAGERQDVVVLAATAMAELEADGHLLAESRVDVARSGMAVAIRAGGPRPHIGDGEAVRQAILDARALCFSTGPSGDHLQRLWESWGIASIVAPRAIKAPPGVPVAAMLARGDADLGFQQLSELIEAPGIEILGPLPPDIQAVTVFTAGIATVSLHVDKARCFVAYLASSEWDTVKRRRGLTPANSTDT